MRIAAYCRVSTDHEEQLSSLINQKEFFESFARNNGHTLVSIYSDEGISGKQMKNRTQFLKMLEDSKLDLFDMVVVKDISRFARNTVDFLTAVRELKSRNIDVQFLSTNQTVLGSSEFILTIFSALAQEESANLSSRVKFGKKQSAKKGKVPNFIYGYTWIDKYNLSVNEEQAEVVRNIFDWYVNEELGARAISNRLQKNGIPNTKGGDFWTEKTIRRILTNTIYKGILISKKSECVNFLTGERKSVKPQKDFIFEREGFRIVDSELFDKAQTILKERAEFYRNKNPRGRTGGAYPFSTLIRCENCGYAFTRRLSNSKEKYVLWKCSGRNSHSSSFCPNKTVVPEDDLRDFLKNYFIKTAGRMDLLCKHIIHNFSESAPAFKDRPEHQIKKLESTRQKYMDMYVNNIISIQELKQKSEKISAEIRDLSEQISAQKNTGIPVFSAEESIENFLKGGRYAHAELKKIIKQILVNDNGDVKIEFFS